MNNNAIMTLRASLNEQIFSYLDLVLPNKTEQIKIGDFLYRINSKIELNNKINAELESMAKLIYDYWFVQFDFPDKNGKPYKSSGGKMVWNEELKREIPEGWAVLDLSTFELYQPQTITENDLNPNEKYFVYGANGIVGKYKDYNHDKSEIVVTCRGNSCGNILRTTPKSWITGNAMVVKSNKDFINTEFIYQTLQRIGIKRAISGSGQPQITRANLSPLKFILPFEHICKKYSEMWAPMEKKRINSFNETNSLISLRDWLLPMLMNGQVTVGDSK